MRRDPPGGHGRHEDTLQLGGNVVVDAEGVVRWVYGGAGPDDRPSVDAVITAVRALD